METAGTTLAAIASPPGPALRGIVRVSGPRAAELVRATLDAESPLFAPENSRQLVRGRFDDGAGLQPVQVLWMKAPRSFTREDVAEFHLCGAPPLLARALARLLALGATPARPGEFTRRAFRNGRLDLSRAEGVLALTQAGNEAERAAAALLLDGGLDARVGVIRERLLACAALCEASLDFDEGETGHVPRAELLALWNDAATALAETHAWETRRAAPSALARVLLTGAPNAGKSSLWNALTGGRALVGSDAGTTRDALEAPLALDGLACLLIDGPGLDEGATGPAERARKLYERRRAQADLVLHVADATSAAAPEPRDAALLVWTKLDLPAARPRPSPLPAVAVSARTGEGLDELRAALVRHLWTAGEGARGAGAVRGLFERHRAALLHAREACAEAGELLVSGAPLDLAAEALRASLAALDELSGRTTPEDVLDRIFAQFCLGK